MKYSLTITDATPSELAKLLATLGASTAINVTQHVAADNGAAPNDDDTTGDVPAAAGGVDANGLPWDARIHSTPATITTKGVWRKGRGVTDALIAQVEAELRSRGGAPVQQQQPMQQPVYPAQQPQMTAAAPQFVPPQQQQPMQQPQFVQPAQIQQPQFVQQPMPQQPPQTMPMQQPAEPAQYDFTAFMQRLQMLLNEKDAGGNPLIDANYLSAVAAHVGQTFQRPVTSITDIDGSPDMINYAIQTMRGQGRWK